MPKYNELKRTHEELSAKRKLPPLELRGREMADLGAWLETYNPLYRLAVAEAADPVEKNLIELQGSMLYLAVLLSQNMDRAEDMVQDLCVWALERKDKFFSEKGIRAALYRRMRKKFISYARKLSEKGEIVNVFDESLQRAILAKIGIDPDKASEAHVDRIRLENALMDLPEAEREVLMLVVEAGQSYQEAAEVLNLSIRSVGRKVSSAKRKMQETLVLS